MGIPLEGIFWALVDPPWFDFDKKYAVTVTSCRSYFTSIDSAENPTGSKESPHRNAFEIVETVTGENPNSF